MDGNGSRQSVVVAYALFVLVGLATGVGTVLLPAQMADYGVDRATIGLTFFPFSAGFVLAGVSSGPLLHRYGTRLVLIAGGTTVFLMTAGYQATRPPFLALVAVQLLAGYGLGMIESVLNAHLAAQPRPATLLNRLHAFFGVGALIGPVLAAWLLGGAATRWTTVLWVLAAASVPAMVAAWLLFPTRAADPLAHERATSAAAAPPSTGSLLPAALRTTAVLLGGALLALYVALEIGVGSWGVTYLTQARATSGLLAAATMSAYWGGLTVGRFVLSPLASRLGLSTVALMYTCLAAVIAASAMVWLVPVPRVAAVGLVLLGFFLGPIFPTMIAVTPDLTPARLAPTAMGVMNAGSVIGGSLGPWAQGAVGQTAGAWTLLPIAAVLGLAQLLVWWRLAAGLGPASAARARRLPAARPSTVDG